MVPRRRDRDLSPALEADVPQARADAVRPSKAGHVVRRLPGKRRGRRGKEREADMKRSMGARTGAVAALLVALAAAGCEPADRQEAGEEIPARPATESAMTPEAGPVTRPDTTPARLWGYLASTGYAETWPRFPGTGELYEGSEPHGALLTTYVSRRALGALEAGEAPLPDSTILVKENYAPDSTLVAVTVMFKVPGYNADHGDWYWLKRKPDGAIEAEGRVQSCIRCHGSHAAGDYIMTTDREPGPGGGGG
jgi:hypothetical protein